MFCESCGRSIADTAANCPYCGQASAVAVASTTTGAAVVPVQAQRGPTAETRAPSGLTRAEQTVYFRLARGFSWLLLIVITIAMVVVVLQLVPVLSQVIGASTSVSPKDLTQALTSPRSANQEDENELNPAEMAQLDQLAYEVIQLLPAEARANQNIDFVRGQIKNAAGNLARERKEQMAILQELRDDLRALPEAQRDKAFASYFDLKRQKIQLDRTRKESAKASLMLLGSSLLAGIALVTFVTMILVLLSIERNTRLATA